ncbi:D-ribose pyranase [Paratractidigestivibacter sp.]|uniref:D-ribose pyranase n=1 Tax=Paratractidigestivibacter sp. TaxID=2847316 RepID=UPI002AC9826C|nr:D-ribose pyranase [Paratractidigestivibacter sp.]
MKRSGILNAQLSRLIAALGHKDTFMIGDAGMPIPAGVEVVDLVLVGGVPTFKQVVDAVAADTVVEHYTVATEIHEKNPELEAYLAETFSDATMDELPHDELKKMSASCRFAIRTGEFTPYPNVILRAGVAFPA